MKNSLWNMLAKVKNGQIVKKAYIVQYKKKICIAFLNTLWDEGFILGYKISGKRQNRIKIFLKYRNGNPAIRSLVALTKPSLRRYYSLNQLWKIRSNNSLIIVSTNKGLYSLDECKKSRIGGELFLLIR